MRHPKECNGLSLKELEPLSEGFSLGFEVDADGVEDEVLDLGPLEEEGHDEIVDIFVLEELALLGPCQVVQSVYFRDYFDHVLHKNADLIDNPGEIL